MRIILIRDKRLVVESIEDIWDTINQNPYQADSRLVIGEFEIPVRSTPTKDAFVDNWAKHCVLEPYLVLPGDYLMTRKFMTGNKIEYRQMTRVSAIRLSKQQHCLEKGPTTSGPLYFSPSWVWISFALHEDEGLGRDFFSQGCVTVKDVESLWNRLAAHNTIKLSIID